MILTDSDRSFGALLQTLRRRKFRTQQQLADALGVHRSTLFRWERGDYLPESKAQVLELARCLKLDEVEARKLLEASLTALSPFWLVPFPRNPYFTGREEILETLHTQLGIDQTVALTQSSALHGLGGVGKTQIALEYAYRHALEYTAVLWVGAETEEQIVTSLLHIAEVLQLTGREEKDQQRVVAAVQCWLSTHEQWLLIWDNVEDLTLLDRFLPATRSGAILLTTRQQNLGTLARGLDLLPMGQEEGLLFLLRRAKMLPPEASREPVRQLALRMPGEYVAAEDLVTVLGGLPLALDQAGAYVEETHCGLPAYLALFHGRRAALLQRRGERRREHPASVSTTLQLAIQAAALRHSAVGDLLRVCALLQAEAIPEELFRQSGEHLGGTLAAVCRDELAWDGVVGMACSYSLLSRQAEEQTFSVHRLVQAVLLDAMTDEERDKWEERILMALEETFPDVSTASEAATWKQCERLLPHARLRVDHRGGACQSLALASLATKVGHFLTEQLRNAEAERLFERALCIKEHVLGPQDLQVSNLLTDLAISSLNQGRYAEAEQFFGRALCIKEQALGPLHPEVAVSLNNLAFLFIQQGRYSEAEQFFERALSIKEQALGPDHPSVATSLKNLAALFLEQGNYAQAHQLVQRALSIFEQTLGPDHPQIVRVLDTQANILREQGKYSEAEPLYLRGLSIWEHHLGQAHPRRALLLTDLAECYRLQHRDVEAEHLFQQSLAIWEQTMGQASVHVTTPLQGLANLARDRGQHTDAESLYLRVLLLREQSLGKSHPDTGDLLHDLALLRRQQGQVHEACTLAKRALAIRSQALGESHPHTIATHALHAHLVQAQACAGDEAAFGHCSDGILDPGRTERHEKGNSSPLQEAASPVPSQDHPLQAFLEACCDLHPRAWCRSADLWQAYEQWSRERQFRYPLSRMAFTQQVKAAGCWTARTNSTRIWRGITLVKGKAVTGSDRP